MAIDYAEFSRLRKLEFKTRSEYAAWRADWRRLLFVMIEKVRAAKRRMRTPGGDPAAQSERARLRVMIAVFIDARLESKIMAGRQSAEQYSSRAA